MIRYQETPTMKIFVVHMDLKKMTKAVIEFAHGSEKDANKRHNRSVWIELIFTETEN